LEDNCTCNDRGISLKYTLNSHTILVYFIAHWGYYPEFYGFGGTHIMSDGIAHVTDDSFEAEVLQADGPVLVDYWAEWCGPCKMIAPVLEEIASEYGDKVKIAKLNIDENPATPPKYGIRGIPTLMLFKGGNVEATKVGAVSKSQLSAFIDENL